MRVATPAFRFAACALEALDPFRDAIAMHTVRPPFSVCDLASTLKRLPRDGVHCWRAKKGGTFYFLSVAIFGGTQERTAELLRGQFAFSRHVGGATLYSVKVKQKGRGNPRSSNP